MPFISIKESGIMFSEDLLGKFLMILKVKNKMEFTYTFLSALTGTYFLIKLFKNSKQNDIS